MKGSPSTAGSAVVATGAKSAGSDRSSRDTVERPAWVVGRPLVVGPDGSLGLREATCLELAAGRIRSVRGAANTPRDAAGDPAAVLAPGWVDSHLHLLACAANRVGCDLSLTPPRSIAELLERVCEASRATPADGWVRVSGYDEIRLAERRHPTRVELDRAAGGRPVRLRHATRHASVLSSAGWQALGDHHDLPPRQVPRDSSGRPLGVAFDLESRISDAVGPLPAGVLAAGLAAASEALLGSGVVAIDEMSAANDPVRVAVLAEAIAAGRIRQRIRVFLGEAEDESAARSAAGGWLEIAGVKLLPADAETIRTPEFGAAVARARARGLPIAIHAVEADAIDAAVDVLETAPPRAVSHRSPDRVEHASLCPPDLVRRIARAGIAVVTQPAFLFERGVKYMQEIEPPLWPWLYPLRSLRAAGVLVAGSSDAPVATADPRVAIEAAISRRSAAGVCLGDEERLCEADSWDLYTGAPRRLRGQVCGRVWRAGGWCAPGEPADLLVLDGDPRGAWSTAAIRAAFVGAARSTRGEASA